MLSRHVVLVANHLDEYRLRLTWGCQPVLAAAGIGVLVHIDDPFESGIPATLVRMLRGAPPVGVIIASDSTSRYEDELAELVAELDVPLVHVAAAEPGPRSVLSDNSARIQSLMAHQLDERGVRRPVIVRGAEGQKDAIEREALVRAEIGLRGVRVDEQLVIDGGFERDLAYRNLRDLLAERRDLDAVVAMNDLSALGAWRALTDCGLRVPEDVLVTGIDNQHNAAMTWPGLTTVDQDLEAQGAAAAECLLRQLQGEDLGDGVAVPTRLVVRGSTSPTRFAGHATIEDERDAAVRIARAAQSRLAEQEALKVFREALMRCGSVAEVMGVLASTYFDGIGVAGFALALFESPDGELAPATGGPYDVRILMQSWGGEPVPTPAELIPVHELTAEPTEGNLLAFQPLAVSDRPLGYFLLEHSREVSELAEVLRMDLSRTFGAVLAGEELSEYARSLERQVNRRTQELEREVSTRRGAEVQLQRLNVELQRSLMIDGLTRIANRAAFQQHLDTHSQGGDDAGGNGQELALLFVDVDLFKQYNDFYGHVAGDAALCQVAACLARATLYPMDLACRWGGEEFAALLPGSGLEGAYRVAERFMQMLHEADIPHARSTVSDRLSASVGIAVTRIGPGTDTAALTAAADRALEG